MSTVSGEYTTLWSVGVNNLSDKPGINMNNNTKPTVKEAYTHLVSIRERLAKAEKAVTVAFGTPRVFSLDRRVKEYRKKVEKAEKTFRAFVAPWDR